MGSQKKQFHVRLPEEFYRQLKAKCAIEGTTIQDCLAALITNSLQAPPSMRPTNEVKPDDLDLVQILEKCPIMSGIERYELGKLAAAADILHFGKGVIIVMEEEVSPLLYIIKEGMVKVFKTSPAGKEFTIDIRYGGETFGLIPVIKGIPHFASAKALEETRVLAIRRQDFLDFMARNPGVASQIIDLEFQRVGDLYGRLMDLVADNADRRLIKTLLALSRKYGHTLPFTHQDIAEMSGISTETATRVMTQLKNSGILRLARGKVAIMEKERLQL